MTINFDNSEQKIFPTTNTDNPKYQIVNIPKGVTGISANWKYVNCL